MRETIARHVDFGRLASSPVRVLLNAVDVSTGEPRIFDSYEDSITPAHVLACGSLPPRCLRRSPTAGPIGTAALSVTRPLIRLSNGAEA